MISILWVAWTPRGILALFRRGFPWHIPSLQAPKSPAYPTQLATPKHLHNLHRISISIIELNCFILAASHLPPTSFENNQVYKYLSFATWLTWGWRFIISNTCAANYSEYSVTWKVGLLPLLIPNTKVNKLANAAAIYAIPITTICVPRRSEAPVPTFFIPWCWHCINSRPQKRQYALQDAIRKATNFGSTRSTSPSKHSPLFLLTCEKKQFRIFIW